MRPLDAWLKSLGLTPRTGRLWEKNGRIKVHRIGPKKYIFDEEIARFFRDEAAKSTVNPGWFGQREAA